MTKFPRILHDLLGQLTKNNFAFSSNPVKPAHLGSLIDEVEQSTINCKHCLIGSNTSLKHGVGHQIATVAKALLSAFIASPNSTSLRSLLTAAVTAASSSSVDYTALCAEILNALPDEADKVRKGSKNVLARLIGEGMKRTQGRADARRLRDALSNSICFKK